MKLKQDDSGPRQSHQAKSFDGPRETLGNWITFDGNIFPPNSSMMLSSNKTAGVLTARILGDDALCASANQPSEAASQLPPDDLAQMLCNQATSSKVPNPKSLNLHREP